MLNSVLLAVSLYLFMKCYSILALNKIVFSLSYRDFNTDASASKTSEF